jgi:alpha-D-ribose 1-methylphosphonate 5-triphosphate synthase subunit PhnG
VTVLKGFVMNAFSTLARKEPWVQVLDDSVRLDVEAMLAREGLTARVNLVRIRCEVGVFHLEAGAGPLVVTS